VLQKYFSTASPTDPRLRREIDGFYDRREFYDNDFIIVRRNRKIEK